MQQKFKLINCNLKVGFSIQQFFYYFIKIFEGKLQVLDKIIKTP